MSRPFPRLAQLHAHARPDPSRRRRLLAAFCLILAALALTTPALSEARQGQRDERRPQAQQEARLSPQQAAARAQASHGGKVLKVTRQGKGYRVRLLLDSGRVVTVTVKD
ncbi:hypothetical protein [Parahaliea mediterranea]|uniref:hypothetical protein n=1 Tax=Parahaliea mediterranea TaxID=651086 RepID=UPI0013002E59|nr:hypothetical protein [Parahaliea mediterranea]